MSYNRGGQSGAVALSYGSSSPMPPLSPSRCYSNGSSATRTTSAIGTSTSKFIGSSKAGTSLRDRPSLFNSTSSTLPSLGSSYVSNCKSYCHGSYYPASSTGIRRNYTRPTCSPARSVSSYSDTGYSSSVLASNGRSSSYTSRDRTTSERTSHVRCSLGSLEPSRQWRHQQTSTFNSDLYGTEKRDLTWRSSGRADLSSCSSSSSSSAVASSSLYSRSRRKPPISTVLTTTGHARADSATSSVEVTIADCRESDDHDEDDGDENHDKFGADGAGNKDNYDGNEDDENDDVNKDGNGDIDEDDENDEDDEDDEDDDDNQQEDQHNNNNNSNNNNNNNDLNRIKHGEDASSCGGYERIDYKDERHGSDDDDDHSNRNNHHHQQQLRSSRILLHNKRVPSVSPSAIATITTSTTTAVTKTAAAAGDSSSGGDGGGGVGGGSLSVSLDTFTNLATNPSNTELLINNNGQGDETQVVVEDDFEIDENNEVIQREVVASSETKFRKTSGQDNVAALGSSSSFKVGDSEFGVASLYSVLQNGVPGRTNGSRTDDTSTPSTSRRQERHLSSLPSPTRQQTAAFHHRATSEQFEGSPTNRPSRSALQGYRDERCGLNGLRNIGNTCFMNSVIQCLSNTRPLLEYVINEKYLSDINTTTSSMKGSLIKAFSQVIHELWQSRADCAVNTTALKSQIQRFTPRFMGYSQQDAQEFLRYLLEGLHEDVNRVTVKPQPIHTDIPDSYTDSQKATESWKRYLRSENSMIVDLFVGQLRSSLHCTFCNHTSVTLDPFWDLSLPIPARSGTVKLNQCFEHFTREEVLDGDEKPTCSKCQMRRKCTKSFRIQKFPKILVIHLKRFSPMERYRGKLNVMVDFPLTDLDLSAFAASRVQGCTYNLYGVANHSGTTHSGHYTAYCKHPYSGEWHEYNDSHVSTVSARSVVSSEAYVLFYEQQPHNSHL